MSDARQPSPPDLDATAVIDLSVLAEVIGNDRTRLQKVAQKFVDSTGAALAELRACLASGDIVRIRELGHRTKSAARIVGALGMGELCERLETLPPQAELADAAELVAQMAALLDRIGKVIAATPSSSSS